MHGCDPMRNIVPYGTLSSRPSSKVCGRESTAMSAGSTEHQGLRPRVDCHVSGFDRAPRFVAASRLPGLRVRLNFKVCGCEPVAMSTSSTHPVVRSIYVVLQVAPAAAGTWCLVVDMSALADCLLRLGSARICTRRGVFACRCRGVCAMCLPCATHPPSTVVFLICFGLCFAPRSQVLVLSSLTPVVLLGML